jgi:hypothetical protein
MAKQISHKMTNKPPSESGRPENMAGAVNAMTTSEQAPGKSRINPKSIAITRKFVAPEKHGAQDEPSSNCFRSREWMLRCQLLSLGCKLKISQSPAKLIAKETAQIEKEMILYSPLFTPNWPM